jgi:succinyl-CoA synthetase beta subunit
LNIHEHQAKELFKSYGVPVLEHRVAYSAKEAVAKALEISDSFWVVKAQIHAGGRGKAGGVILCTSIEDVKSACEKLLGSTLITHQTGPEGREVKRLLIEAGCQIDKEFYLSFTLDRQNHCVTLVASKEGGMDIEEVAEKNPEAITHISIPPVMGIQPYMARRVAQTYGIIEKTKDIFVLLSNLYKLYVEKDAELMEINPLVLTKQGDLVALDAKMAFDDNALYRHSDIQALRDENEEEEEERQAKAFDLSYIKLSGNIGCMVNGAGLAMATMDIIKKNEGEPANFLDVGGSATEEKVSEALKIILSDASVKTVLINIFGGIMRCDVIAQGLIAAVEKTRIKNPLIVRLEGTNKEEGENLIKAANLNITFAKDLDEAARLAVTAAKGA